LIGVNTLQLLVVSTMFNHFIEDDDALYVPMIDARRMEVYTAAYNSALQTVMKPQAMILDEHSLDGLLQSHHLVLMGNGSDKARQVLDRDGVNFIESVKPVAVDMTALAEKAFRENDFIDVAYSTPLYLKEFQATKPKNPVLNL
ncbi:MAG: tRNA (adenosine(37)-N6)-threonylcarbamoyltransferase complex dimerization subunit type 1 TsaB, partial [Muribaculaceae bacterium]|nr:tRNA (adenosine(37)-N6)-threonylcarbamoyltransferase complex dimerization subunit type 1 TsaB [Muribaculaceae bacterium]